MGLQYLSQMELESQAVRDGREAGVAGLGKGISFCSIGDAAMTEGEVAEAFHMTALRQLPMVWLVQDNEWDISAHSSEVRFEDATTFAKAFPGIEVLSVDGTDWDACSSHGPCHWHSPRGAAALHGACKRPATRSPHQWRAS